MHADPREPTDGFDFPLAARQRVPYRITVRTTARLAGSDWWTATSTANADGTTTIAVRVDQAALRGILCQLWDLNAVLIAVVRVLDSSEP